MNVLAFERLQKRRLHHFCQSFFPLIRHYRRRFRRYRHHRHRCRLFHRPHCRHRLDIFRGKQSDKRVTIN